MKSNRYAILSGTNLNDLLTEIKSNDPKTIINIIVDTSKIPHSILINFYTKLISETKITILSIVGPAFEGNLDQIVEAVENNYYLTQIYLNNNNPYLTNIINNYANRNKLTLSFIEKNKDIMDKTENFNTTDLILPAETECLTKPSIEKLLIRLNTYDLSKYNFNYIKLIEHISLNFLPLHAICKNLTNTIFTILPLEILCKIFNGLEVEGFHPPIVDNDDSAPLTHHGRYILNQKRLYIESFEYPLRDMPCEKSIPSYVSDDQEVTTSGDIENDHTGLCIII